MGIHRIHYVDVFTDRALFGNPVAVVFDAEAIDDTAMRRIAAFTNLSETVFVLPVKDDADYRLRIFTPRNELPFAGHPTIGACHAVRTLRPELASKGAMVQACAAGLIPLLVEGAITYARVPKPSITRPSVAHEALCAALGVTAIDDPRVIDCGPRWLVAAVHSVSALYALRRDELALVALSRDLGVTGVTLYALDGATPHVRSFAPADGISEDPVCGSGNACVGAHLRETGRAHLTGNAYVAHQGRGVARDGRVSVRLEGEEVHIGGQCVTVVEGTLCLA
jgi:PhzF family phenazine biosynthesis protein